MSSDQVKKRAYARVGLLGNPSDGYNGKVISFALSNFYAEVRMISGQGIQLVPHVVHDSCQHQSLGSLSAAVETRGYTGGIQLLLAACRVFWQQCQEKSLGPLQKGFTMSYETNIPRQAGLSGSSAIVTAALACLIDFYGVDSEFPATHRPNLALQAEAELGIAAGLQDRVIQVYEGLLYMDFGEALMEAQGFGRYEPLDPSLLPPLWVIYSGEPSHSGRVHSRVREKWTAGDPRTRQLMTGVASLAEQGKRVILERRHDELRRLMRQNVQLRLELFGPEVLGPSNLRMVEIVETNGGAAKLCGSGGAVVASFPESAEANLEAVRRLCESEGFVLVRADIMLP